MELPVKAVLFLSDKPADKGRLTNQGDRFICDFIPDMAKKQKSCQISSWNRQVTLTPERRCSTIYYDTTGFSVWTPPPFNLSHHRCVHICCGSAEETDEDVPPHPQPWVCSCCNNNLPLTVNTRFLFHSWITELWGSQRVCGGKDGGKSCRYQK